MAIIKFLCEESDFSSVNATRTTSFFDPERVEYGYVLFQSSGFTANWSELTGNDFWFHYAYSQSSISNNWTDRGALVWYDSQGNKVINFQIAGSSSSWVVYGDTSTNTVYTEVPSTHVMYDVHLQKSGTDLILKVYRDGALIVNNTVANTAGFGLPTALTSTIIDAATSLTYMYFGECVIADEDTRGWRLRQHKVTGYGINQDWTGAVTAITDSSHATAIRTNTLDDRAGFGVTNLENIPIGAVIDRVVVSTVAQRGAAGLASMNQFFRYAGGTITDDVDIALAEDAKLFISEYPTSPNTGLAWTDTEMAGLQYGVRART